MKQALVTSKPKWRFRQINVAFLENLNVTVNCQKTAVIPKIYKPNGGLESCLLKIYGGDPD